MVLLKMTVVQLTTLKKFVMCDDAKDTQGVDESPLNTLDPVRSIPKFINSPLIDCADGKEDWDNDANDF